jgi:hypothetical protein
MLLLRAPCHDPKMTCGRLCGLRLSNMRRFSRKFLKDYLGCPPIGIGPALFDLAAG